MAEIIGRAARLAGDPSSEVPHRAETEGGGALREVAESLPRYGASPLFRMRYARLLRRNGRPLQAAVQYTEALRLLPPEQPALRNDILRHLARTLADIAPPSPPTVSATELAFSQDQPGVACLTEGWFAPEDWGCWLRGFAGRLRFLLPKLPVEGLRLRFGLSVFVDRAGSQTVRVFFNGREVALWLFDRPGEAERIVELGRWIGEDATVDIAFFVAHPTAPAETGATDTRPLGLGLRTLAVEPL